MRATIFIEGVGMKTGIECHREHALDQFANQELRLGLTFLSHF